MVLPFFCLLLPRPSDLSRSLRWLFFAAAIVSIVNMFVITAVDVMAGPGRPESLYFDFYERLFSGDYPRKVRGGAFLGRLFGLPPLADLMPLTISFAALVWWLWPRRQVKPGDDCNDRGPGR
jgi:hypothetical protein